MKVLKQTKTNNDSQIELQPVSQSIWADKYQLKDLDGKPIDLTIDDTFKRVAKALCGVESCKTKQEKWYKLFLWALRNGAVPAGRVLSNAGAEAYKPATSTINCTVSSTIHDSMNDILRKNHLAGMTLKAGCGIGYEFSTLRPNGAFVSGAGAYTSGPLSFMDIYDKTCFTVSSAGGRRGAQMATFDIHHPDVMEFIRAKRENGRLRQFNLSLLITNDFINAVRNGEQWHLSFPIKQKEVEDKGIDIHTSEMITWRSFPVKDNYIVDDKGQVACLIYKTISAKRLWDLIMASTYDFAEPGFILIDEVNKMNNNWFCENIRATNPCGEQPLPEDGSCLLGSVNLTRFVVDPFTDNARFDFDKFNKVVSIFTRMLDNVVEVNGLPLEPQVNEILRKRRHGMGFLGLGSALAMLKVPYGTEEAVELTNTISQNLAITGWTEALELAKEKGPAPIMTEKFKVTSEMLAIKPQMASDGFKEGDEVAGSVLHAKYSNYMQRIALVAPDLVEELSQVGARFTHHSSIAPTGTISLTVGNNVSNGIEPSFGHHYSRNIIKQGKKSKEKVDVYSYELLAYKTLVNPDVDPNATEGENQLPDYFVTVDSLSPKQHVDMQAAAQIWVDSSISKTINVPTDCPYDDFKDVYMYACDSGLKGCTTFRYNPEVHQGVLVKDSDLENTTYIFTLEDGSKVELKGNEQVEYDGEVHTAANLMESLKEGFYGKF